MSAAVARPQLALRGGLLTPSFSTAPNSNRLLDVTANLVKDKEDALNQAHTYKTKLQAAAEWVNQLEAGYSNVIEQVRAALGGRMWGTAARGPCGAGRVHCALSRSQPCWRPKCLTAALHLHIRAELAAPHQGGSQLQHRGRAGRQGQGQPGHAGHARRLRR